MRCKQCEAEIDYHLSFCGGTCMSLYATEQCNREHKPAPFEPHDHEEDSALEKATYQYINNLTKEITKQNKACRKKNSQIARLRERNAKQNNTIRLKSKELIELRRFLLDVVHGSYAGGHKHEGKTFEERCDRLLTKDYELAEKTDKIIEKMKVQCGK